MSEPGKLLDYETPEPSSSPPVGKQVLQAMIGCAMSAGLLVLLPVLAAIVGLKIVRPAGSKSSTVYLFVGIGIIVAAALIGTAALHQRRAPRRSGFEVGLWMGLGLSLLMGAYLCFA